MHETDGSAAQTSARAAAGLAAMFSLHGETALITGGGSGLGFGIARAFVIAGAQVVLAGRRESVLWEACTELGSQSSYFVHDVTETNAAPQLLGEIEKRNGPVSVLVNNAGIHLKKPFLETTEAEFLRVLETHVTGSYALTRAAAPGMMKRRHGSVLFLASMTSLIGMPRVIAYTTAKTAFVGLVRGLAAELSPCGVRVNAIAPGWIESPMLNEALSQDEERKNKVLSRTPIGRFGEPEDIGAAAVYLCSSASRFVTGVVLPVDGGASVSF
jgi:NAD(P)-dependent dehydrogenase (short-subunit alcohol dehydrogenase family)